MPKRLRGEVTIRDLKIGPDLAQPVDHRARELSARRVCAENARVNVQQFQGIHPFLGIKEELELYWRLLQNPARRHTLDTGAHRSDRPRSPNERLPRRQWGLGARRRQMECAYHRAAGRWPATLQRDQADGRRHFTANADADLAWA